MQQRDPGSDSSAGRAWPAEGNNKMRDWPLTLLALLDLSSNQSWAEASAPLMGVTPIIVFCREQYGKVHQRNMREVVRQPTLAPVLRWPALHCSTRMRRDGQRTAAELFMGSSQVRWRRCEAMATHTGLRPCGVFSIDNNASRTLCSGSSHGLFCCNCR